MKVFSLKEEVIHDTVLGQYIVLTLNGLEGHICPSLVKDWKDISVPLLSHHGGVIILSFRASCTLWCNKNYYIMVRGA